jgi:23S rRNA maturation-related 3'-5' exoribonuclease YhaM
MKRIMKVRSVYLEKNVWDFLKKHSSQYDRSINWAVTNIIENWIKRNGMKCGAIKKKENEIGG